LDVVELAQCIHDGIEDNRFLSVGYLERAPASSNGTAGASKTALRRGLERHAVFLWQTTMRIRVAV
jgi:hypothetical protein